MLTACSKQKQQEQKPEAYCTIDSALQEMVTRELGMKMDSLLAPKGCAIVMETNSGNIKALVNMEITEGDTVSHESDCKLAFTQLLPGSAFKIASILVAMDDGKVTKETIVETGCGLYNMHGKDMKDWGWETKGGFGPISVKDVLALSSRVGVSRIIDENYGDNPQMFLDGLKRVGANVPLQLEGCPDAVFPAVGDSTWDATSLPWLSVGLNEEITPMHTCAFYNGIANNGKMVAPRLMTDSTQMPKVLVEQMCKPSVLADMKEIMLFTTDSERCTGRRMRNDGFGTCGKTSSAILKEQGENSTFFISVCSFFPADNPKYTCFVGMIKEGRPASGGGFCGSVFSRIAKYMMDTEK